MKTYYENYTSAQVDSISTAFKMFNNSMQIGLVHPIPTHSRLRLYICVYVNGVLTIFALICILRMAITFTAKSNGRFTPLRPLHRLTKEF